MFKVGARVYVAEQDYHGEVVEVRKAGRKREYLVRYTVPFARKEFYETWWPQSYLSAPKEG